MVNNFKKQTPNNFVWHLRTTVLMEHTALSAAAPVVLNSLDINARLAETFLTFRRILKTELFIKSYDTWTLGLHHCTPDSHAINIFCTFQIVY